MSNAAVSTDVLANVRSQFAFAVDKFPLSGPDNMRTPFYGLFRSDNQAVVGRAVSNLYVPHQTDDVLALVESAAVAFDGIAEVKCHFRDGHFVAIEPSKDYRRNIFGTADNVFPRIIVNASYDGRAFSAACGYWRDLCKNMHRMVSVRSTWVSIRHTSGLRKQMDDLIQTFSVLRDSWATLADVIARMESRTVSMVDFLDAVYGRPETDGKALTIHQNRTKAIFDRLSKERYIMGKPSMSASDNYAVSAWEAFNAIQGYTQHESRRRAGFKGDFDRFLAANADAHVQKAERLALVAV